MDGCEECLATGDPWLHLRICLECGKVGCCDDSPNRHASAHAQSSGHPLIRSLEPGETWSWCFPDDLALVISQVKGETRTVAASVQKIDQFNYVTTLIITPLFLVAGTFFPINQLPEAAQVAANFNPLYQLVELVRAAAFGLEATDLIRFAVLVAFAVVLWRVAVRRMTTRLIE